MKTLIKKTLLVLALSVFASSAQAAESKVTKVYLKAVKMSGETYPASFKFEVVNKTDGTKAESFIANSKMVLLPLSSKFSVTAENIKTGETKSQDFSTSFEPSGSSEVILKFEK